MVKSILKKNIWNEPFDGRKEAVLLAVALQEHVQKTTKHARRRANSAAKSLELLSATKSHPRTRRQPLKACELKAHT